MTAICPILILLVICLLTACQSTRTVDEEIPTSMPVEAAPSVATRTDEPVQQQVAMETALEPVTVFPLETPAKEAVLTVANVDTGMEEPKDTESTPTVPIAHVEEQHLVLEKVTNTVEAGVRPVTTIAGVVDSTTVPPEPVTLELNEVFEASEEVRSTLRVPTPLQSTVPTEPLPDTKLKDAIGRDEPEVVMEAIPEPIVESKFQVESQVETVVAPPPIYEWQETVTPPAEVPVNQARPKHLVPGAIPEDITYKLAPDAEVIQAAELLQSYLQGRGQFSSFGNELLMVYAGAWGLIENQPALNSSDYGSSYVILPPNGGALEVEGAMAIAPEDVAAVLSALRAAIGDGGEIRAMQTLEMAEWWTHTGFDIEEPVFVVESQAQSKQYLFIFQQGKIAIVDELSALPDLL